MERTAGVLLHPTCLPGEYGIGDLGPRAEEFLEWLEAAGQSYWQLLPLGPVGVTGSPYDAQSAFACNPLLVSPEELVSWGLLDVAPEAVAGDRERVDFAAVRSFKDSLLRDLWRRRGGALPRDLKTRFQAFREDPDVRLWLPDWALFAALKRQYPNLSWQQWPDTLRRREAGALEKVRIEMAAEVDYQSFIQFIFFEQWGNLRRKAARRGVKLFGDLAIYVALDSADVWANQEIFDLDEDGWPRVVAGVPPDYFAATGQRWGNPLYDWRRLEETGFSWWIDRLRWNLRLVDVLRLDHFRGFEAYWEIPAEDETAGGGRWRRGPGLAFFEAANTALGHLPLVAEDLGVITAEVTALRQAAGLPGMRVLQFAFDETTSEHRPHRAAIDTVIYTGTHDNSTARGWFESLSLETRQRVLDYVGGSSEDIAWSLIRAAFTSTAATSITPLQDVLCLDDRARLNLPGVGDGQWSWRVSSLPDAKVTDRLRRLTAVTERLPPALPGRGGDPQR